MEVEREERSYFEIHLSQKLSNFVFASAGAFAKIGGGGVINATGTHPKNETEVMSFQEKYARFPLLVIVLCLKWGKCIFNKYSVLCISAEEGKLFFLRTGERDGKVIKIIEFQCIFYQIRRCNGNKINGFV